MVKVRKKKQVFVKQNKSDDSDSNQDDVTEDMFTDEINDFTENRNKIDLHSRDQESDEEEELFALANDDDESDEEIQEWSERLKQVKFQAKLDKKKVVKEAPEKSWGSKRTDFYGSGIRRKPKTTADDEEDEWIMEAKELEKLQKKMDEDMDEDDFLVPSLIQKKSKSKSNELKVQRDLSESAKKQLQEQQHPEMEPLRADLDKCVEKVESLKDSTDWKAQSMDTVYRMYGAHIAFYLHMLETGEDTRGHPVLDRLLEWKKLVKVYENIPPECMETSEEEDESKDEEAETNRNKSVSKERIAFGDSEEEDEEENEEDEDEELTNRPINYLIEKNKPKKKSAPNNPRVKHREKFRKAKIRRKGKVRDFKPEIEKYRGETSGIRSGIVRSRRLK